MKFWTTLILCIAIVTGVQGRTYMGCTSGGQAFIFIEVFFEDGTSAGFQQRHAGGCAGGPWFIQLSIANPGLVNDPSNQEGLTFLMENWDQPEAQGELGHTPTAQEQTELDQFESQATTGSALHVYVSSSQLTSLAEGLLTNPTSKNYTPSTNGKSLTVFPNPVVRGGWVNLYSADQSSGNHVIRIVDISGREYLRESIAGRSSVSLSIPHEWPSGFYVVSWQTPTTQQHRKVFVR